MFSLGGMCRFGSKEQKRLASLNASPCGPQARRPLSVTAAQHFQAALGQFCAAVRLGHCKACHRQQHRGNAEFHPEFVFHTKVPKEVERNGEINPTLVRRPPHRRFPGSPHAGQTIGNTGCPQGISPMGHCRGHQVRAARLAACNGTCLHLAALTHAAMRIRRDACRHRLGQESAPQQPQANDEDSSHRGTVPQQACPCSCPVKASAIARAGAQGRPACGRCGHAFIEQQFRCGPTGAPLRCVQATMGEQRRTLRQRLA